MLTSFLLEFKGTLTNRCFGSIYVFTVIWPSRIALLCSVPASLLLALAHTACKLWGSRRVLVQCLAYECFLELLDSDQLAYGHLWQPYEHPFGKVDGYGEDKLNFLRFHGNVVLKNCTLVQSTR